MMRLDKFLADMGIGTRSQVKQIIKKGQVQINGTRCTSADTKIDENNDEISYNGKLLTYEKNRYYLLNKPAGYVCANSDKLHKTVFELLKGEQLKGLFTVGRLDIDTEGLLIITNDGSLSHELLSPSKHVNKTYYAKINGIANESHVEACAKGIDIGDDTPTQSASLVIRKTNAQNNTSEIELTITEGRYHQVKRMFHALGMEVTYLKRISMGNLKLDDKLPLGSFRRLTAGEINMLYSNKS
ncbi:MAG: rRNA pseudouridine synthase [Coprococcus sp.]|nr:rRNA pseudouridine synthase [Coprococcus sp.]